MTSTSSPSLVQLISALRWMTPARPANAFGIAKSVITYGPYRLERVRKLLVTLDAVPSLSPAPVS